MSFWGDCLPVLPQGCCYVELLTRAWFLTAEEAVFEVGLKALLLPLRTAFQTFRLIVAEVWGGEWGGDWDAWGVCLMASLGLSFARLLRSNRSNRSNWFTPPVAVGSYLCYYWSFWYVCPVAVKWFVFRSRNNCLRYWYGKIRLFRSSLVTLLLQVLLYSVSFFPFWTACL